MLEKLIFDKDFGLKKIVFYVPHDNAQSVKDAIFSAGAGHIGNYDQCCFESDGTGQFRPLENANPAVGNVGQVERVKELKIETICPDDKVKDVLEALRMAHVYEEPAIDVYQLENF
jgi:hypothetical protein